MFYFHSFLTVEFFQPPHFYHYTLVLLLFPFFVCHLTMFLFIVEYWYFVSCFIIFLSFRLGLDTIISAATTTYVFSSIFCTLFFSYIFVELSLLFIFIFSQVYAIFFSLSNFLVWFSTFLFFDSVSVSGILIGCDCSVCTCLCFIKLVW